VDPLRRLILLALAVAVLAPAAPASAAACDRYASPTGSDGNSGSSADAPFLHVQKLVSSLQSGQTGCLLPGTFPTDPNTSEPDVIFTQAGVTLTSSSAASPATVRAYLLILAKGVTIAGIRHDQTLVAAKPGLRIEADDVRLLGNELFNDSLPCVFVAPPNKPAGVVIEGNRIHNCATGTGSSAVSLESAKAPRVVDNYLTATPAFGVVMYPDGDDAVIEHNVIDSAAIGVDFGGDGTSSTTGSSVRDNVITHSSDYNVGAYYAPGSDGSGNTVIGNCLDGANGDLQSSDDFTASDNILIGGLNPYADASSFRLAAGGPCAGKGPLPAVSTGAVTPAQRGATVRGEVNPHFQSARWRAEYGTTAGLGATTGLKDAGEGSLPVAVEGTIDGLAPATTYYYRLVAENLSGGSRTGATASFTTPALPDGDGDGIPDEADSCKTTARGTYDANVDGCPDDSDLDGVLDATDACRTVARGPFDVNADGCPDDSDKDGIPDATDDCRTIDRGPYDSDKDGCPNAAPKLLTGPAVAKYAFFMRGSKRTAIFFKSMRLPVDEPGATARLVCLKKCKLTERRTAAKPGTLRFKKLAKRRLPLTAVLEIRVTKPGRTGIAFRMTVDGRHGEVDITRRCIPPGALKPTRDKC
jgi:hypothetical protein